MPPFPDSRLTEATRLPEDSVTGRGTRVLLAALTATPFVYVPGILYPSVVPREVYFRFLLSAAVLLLAVVWARGRWSPGTAVFSRDRVALGLVAYMAVVTVAAVSGRTPVEGLLGGMVRMDGAITWLFYLLFYLVLRTILDGKTWPSFLRLVALVSTVVAGWSLVQAYGGLVGIALVGWGSTRVIGTLGLEGPLGIYMLLGAAVAGYLVTRARRPVARIGWLAVVAADLWVAVLTGTRSVLVAAALAVLGLVGWSVLAGGRTGRARTLALRSLVGLGGVVLGALLLADGTLPAVARMVDIGSEALASRLHLWRTAWAGFLENPVLGVGVESFDLLYDGHFQPADYLASGAAHHDRAHNVILGALAETGMLGLVAYAAFWTAAFRAAMAAVRSADEHPGRVWLALSVVAYFVYLLLWFEDLASFHVLLVVLAYLAHLREERLTAGSKEREPSGGKLASGGTGPAGTGLSRWAAVGVVAVALAASSWYHLQVLGAARETQLGMTSRQELEPFRHFDRALAHETATTREITSRYVGALEGLAALTRSGEVSADPDSVAAFFHRARRAVEAEVARHPDHSPVHARLARLDRAQWRWSGARSDLRRAERNLRRALELSPDRVRYLHRLARLHTQAGDPERAMALLERADRRLPGWWETYNTMAQVQWDAGNRERAVELLHRAAASEVRRTTAGTRTQFMVRAGAWLEARGTPMEAVALYDAYLGSRIPGWTEPASPRRRDVPGEALAIASRLPITLLQAGRPDRAARAAERLRRRLPPHLVHPEVTGRLERFITDMRNSRIGPWEDAWGVLPTDVPLEG